MNGTSTFHVSRLPLCGDVAINPGPLKPKAPKFFCKECSETIRRNRDSGRHLACRMQWLVSSPSESVYTCSNLVSSGYSGNQASTLDLWAVFFAKDNCRVLSAKFLRWFRLLWLSQNEIKTKRGTSLIPCCWNTALMSRLDISTLTSKLVLSSMRIKHGFWMVDLTFWLSLKQRSIQPSLTPNFTSLGLECVERTGPKAAVV